MKCENGAQASLLHHKSKIFQRLVRDTFYATAHQVLCGPQGIRVGEHWKDRLDCRQWGAHFPHVAGIAGQSGQGAQSVVLSGGCTPPAWLMTKLDQALHRG